jgi:hypothetical protein
MAETLATAWGGADFAPEFSAAHDLGDDHWSIGLASGGHP